MPGKRSGNGNTAGSNHHAGDQSKSQISPYAKRIRAIEALLIEKGVLTREDVQRQVDYLESRSPADGARVVARAWVDPEFKARLLQDPKAAMAELGLTDIGLAGEVEFVVLENTEQVRHMVVCTLCSCYPRGLLGRPPDWYKSYNYRSRAVIDPRGVMREFGLEVGPEVEVRVHDSTADRRYLILPLRPPGTERLSEQELARLVTRDTMIGVADPRPEPAAA